VGHAGARGVARQGVRSCTRRAQRRVLHAGHVERGPPAPSSCPVSCRWNSVPNPLTKRVAFGTPACVTDRLTPLREEPGINGIIAELNPGGRIPLELETRSLRLLTHE
jgi:hypothetical protein